MTGIRYCLGSLEGVPFGASDVTESIDFVHSGEVYRILAKVKRSSESKLASRLTHRTEVKL
jgi:hypothetical protein